MEKFLGPIANALLVSVLALLLLETASGVPYCLLRAPYNPPQGNCFQFYLADTATSPARAIVAGGVCAVTPLAAREGWEPDPTFPGPLSTWSAGDAAMGVVSPYFDDVYGCHAASGNNAGVGNGGGNGTGSGQLTLDVSGKWDIQSSYGSNTPFPMDMELTQSGNSVSGTYFNGQGSIQGTLQGNTLSGTWSDSSGNGIFQATFADDGMSFSGSWDYNNADPNNPDTWNGAWDGTKVNGGVSCPSGQTNCNGTCTDTSSDSNNCGYCGNVCSSGTSCVSGSCSASASTGTGGQSNWDKPFATAQYLVHATWHGTIDGPVKDDWWFLYAQAPQNGVLYLPDGSGGTFTYSIDQSLGPFNSPREVCNAAAGKIGDSSLGAWNSQDTFSCKNMA